MEAKRDQPLLRPEDVAERLAVSKVTVYRLARSGELAGIRIRGQLRFRAEALEAYLARCEAEAPPAWPTKPPVRTSPLRGRPRKRWVPPDAA